jgi:hypothetical protein
MQVYGEDYDAAIEAEVAEKADAEAAKKVGAKTMDWL